MIKYTPASERTLALFETPFEQKLSAENRWVRMAELVPWDEMAEVFISCLSTDQGRPTVDLRYPTDQIDFNAFNESKPACTN